ncbi:GNAT family N-acetyltransferase [Bacillus sp. FJAT-27245]|uniref:GNAT family N-acetyltransferase n=1 Tax=Bacillus sp. FJAT-27245 TaxID=1684144 RepID=UPI0006A7D61B|nr:GNAT family N-acetyltransferase [Bacillus sp. FJAT-27245]
MGFDIELLNFRKLNSKDLDIMHKWLNNGFAAKWYGKKQMTIEDVKEKYLPYINNEKPTQSYIFSYENKPIGYIQTYKINDYPDYEKQVAIDENASGLDLFIGEDEFIHKGLGKYIIRKFLKEIVFSLSGAVSCILGPEPDNVIAIKTYEKVGFKYVKTIRTDDGEEYIMRIGKDEFINNRKIKRN